MTHEQMKRLAAAHPPPQSFFDDEEESLGNMASLLTRAELEAENRRLVDDHQTAQSMGNCGKLSKEKP